MSEEYQYPHSVKPLPVVSDKPEPPASEAEPPKTATASGPPASDIEQKLLEGKVIAALRTVYDPEIPVNIYDLGLIYEIAVRPDRYVKINMTLTSPGCPVAGTLPGEVQTKVAQVEGVADAEVVLVWEPTWDRSRMSEEAQLALGFL